MKNCGENNFGQKPNLRRPNSQYEERHYAEPNPQMPAELRRPITMPSVPGWSSEADCNNTYPSYGPPAGLMRDNLQPVANQNIGNFAPSNSQWSSNFPSNLSPFANVFVPAQVQCAPEFIPYVEPVVDFENHPGVKDLRQAMFTLTINPGKFHSRAPSLSENLNEMVKEENIFHHVVDIIFDQSIVEPNFRYTGARLCDYLQKNLKLKMSEGDFRNYLLNCCKKEYDSIKDKASFNRDEKSRLQGFVMFMAELFTNMEIDVEGVKNKLKIIGNVLPKIMSKLGYDDKDDSNFKCLCQALKLTGAALDKFEKEQNDDTTKTMDDLFVIVEQHSSSEKLKGITKEMLNKVLRLRKNNWEELDISSSSSNDNQPSNSSSNGPVFYGPDGQPISNEEVQFLQSNQSDEPTTGENIGSGSDGIEDEMDEEMYDAYEEFLAQSSKRN